MTNTTITRRAFLEAYNTGLFANREQNEDFKKFLEEIIEVLDFGISPKKVVVIESEGSTITIQE